VTTPQELVDAHGYITTSSGRRIDLSRMHPSDVVLSDVVHALGMQCRYNGHVRSFYSVAEHVVMVCTLAEREHGHGSPIARAALLHDAGEAYVGDFPSPLKRLVPGFREFERGIEAVVCEALRLPPPDDGVWECVKVYDRHALHQEASCLFSPPPPWVREVPVRYLHPVHCLSPRDASLRLALKLREYGFELDLKSAW